MSQMFEPGHGTSGLSDKEIAEDILTGKKYISNYYYAPAVLESMNSELRSTFQQINNNTQSQAKEVFDYLNSKGWYKPRQADAESLNELKNTAQESKRILSSGATENSNLGGKSIVIGSQSSGWQSHSSFQPQQTNMGWQTHPSSQQHQQTGSSYHQSQTHQGQAGTSGHLTPSGSSQWSHWGGQPGQSQQSTQGHSGVFGSHWTSGSQSSPIGHSGYGWHMQGGPLQHSQVGTGWQPSFSQTPQWTGTQTGEGQSGMGPSSLAQWAHWGGQPSLMQQGTGGHASSFGSQGNVGSHSGYGTHGGYGSITDGTSHSSQLGTGWQPTYSQTPQWTGTQSGEGQSGMGPSSLAQWSHWGGQPSWSQSHSGTQQGQWR